MGAAAEREPGKRGSLFVVSAPSGAGKTTLVRTVTQQDARIRVSVSHTTRAGRAGEVDGVAYHFVDEPTFLRLREAGEFLEHARVFDHYYGTSRHWVEQALAAGTDVILEIDWQGARQVRALLPDTVGIFILPPGIPDLLARLGERGDDAAIVARRMRDARSEMSHYAEFDYIVINAELLSAQSVMLGIIHACRAGYRPNRAYFDSMVGKLLREADGLT